MARLDRCVVGGAGPLARAVRHGRTLRAVTLLGLMSCAPAEQTRPEPTATSADVESLEACVLESAVSGHEADCIGLWSDSCVAEGHDPDVCAHLESRLWVGILLDAVPEGSDLPYPAMLRATAACERAGGPPGRCERDGAASEAIPALILAEGR